MEFNRNLTSKDLGHRIKEFSKSAAKLGMAALTAYSIHVSLPSSVDAAGPITGGFYTNMSGVEAGKYGIRAGSYNGEADCDPVLGYCMARDRQGNFYLGGRVEKYVCKTTELNPLTQCDGDHNANLLIKRASYSYVHYIDEGGDSSKDMKADHVIELVVRDENGNVVGFLVKSTGIGDEAARTCTGVMARSSLEARLTAVNYNGPWTLDSEVPAYNEAACGDRLAKASNPESMSPDQTALKATETCSADGTVTTVNISGEFHPTSRSVWAEMVDEETGKREVFMHETFPDNMQPNISQFSVSLPGNVHSIREVSSMDIKVNTPYKMKIFQVPDNNTNPSDEEVIDEALVVPCRI